MQRIALLVALLVVSLALAGCTNPLDDKPPARYSTWPIMDIRIGQVIPLNDTQACPFPYEHQTRCHEVRVEIELENLHDELDVCLCDLMVVADASDSERLQPVTVDDANERLKGGKTIALWHTWSLPPGVKLDRLTLEHTRPYYDSNGAVAVRIIADLEMPAY